MEDRGFQPIEINVPTLKDISELYRKATATSDVQLQTAAQQAVQRLAAAEAAAAEAATLVGFARLTQG